MRGLCLLTGVVVALTYCGVAVAQAGCRATALTNVQPYVELLVVCDGNVKPEQILDSMKNISFTYPVIDILAFPGNALDQIPTGAFNFSQGLQLLDVHHNLLNAVPTHAFTEHLKSLRKLDLSSNLITALDADAFSNLSQLKELNLTSNHIRNMSRWTFRGLNGLLSVRLGQNLLESIPEGFLEETPRLESLYLDDNLLKSISSTLFNSASLTRLSLRGNHIAQLSDGVFSAANRLRYLDLSRNLIMNVSESAFHGLHNLVMLGLTANRIHDLQRGTFEEVGKLDRLSLNRNYIASLPAGIFQPLFRLTRLDLSDNPIESLDGWGLHTLLKLESLDLSLTHIRRLPDLSSLKLLDKLDLDKSSLTKVYGCDLEMLPSLTWIRVTGCPLTCNCELGWLLQWYLDQADAGLRSVVRRTTVCSQLSDAALRGRRLLDLSISDLCPKGISRIDFCGDDDGQHWAWLPPTTETSTIPDIQSPPIRGTGRIGNDPADSMDKPSPLGLKVDRTRLSSVTLKWLRPSRDAWNSTRGFLRYHTVHNAESVYLKVDPYRAEYTLAFLHPVTTYNICLVVAVQESEAQLTDCVFASTSRGEFIVTCAVLVVGIPGFTFILIALLLVYFKRRKRPNECRGLTNSETPVAFYTNTINGAGSVTIGSNGLAEGVDPGAEGDNPLQTKS